jgi:mRNA interferase MazF
VADELRVILYPWFTIVKCRSVPLSSKTGRLYPSEAAVVLEGKQIKAMSDQLATVSKVRLFRHAGILTPEDMRKVEEAVKIQLAFL